MDLDILVCQRHEDVGKEGSGGDASGDEAVVVCGDRGCIEGGEEVGKEVGGEGSQTKADGGERLEEGGGCSLEG